MRHYEVITYETGPRTCDRCRQMNQPWMLNQYPPVTLPPREVCNGCLKLDKADGTFQLIILKWEGK